MSGQADECIHGLLTGTCSICNRSAAASPTKPPRAGANPQTLDTPESVEHYRRRYPGVRGPTFDAYVEVFFGTSSARAFPGGFTAFTRHANAEPALARDHPELVKHAEELMRNAGYVADDSGRPGVGRIWTMIDPEQGHKKAHPNSR